MYVIESELLQKHIILRVKLTCMSGIEAASSLKFLLADLGLPRELNLDFQMYKIS